MSAGTGDERCGSDAYPLPMAYDGEDPAAMSEFHDLLHGCIQLPDDQQFWSCLEEGLQRIEETLPPGRAAGFEYAVDRILVQQGLTTWAFRKGRTTPAA
ncbi:hypothetical protein FZO89_03415 [Luteimonas viscosa]|uniref:Uncharacterized protein n=1 Tax=Luteimonas viscosa TaxID=1132694 RepID=A0A5D4XRN5_9GAMM|nr:hypothetical protein [Luteimonas viscosa]TYT25390.1 hypothetical protein FZO89_03415 [Luteimonas viscosa]